MTRFTGFIAGILTFLITFIYKIPIPVLSAYTFKIISLNEVDYTFWGQIHQNTGEVINYLTLQIPENLVALSIFLIMILIGTISIMTSTTKAKVTNSLKLYRINILLIVLILFIYGWNIAILYPNSIWALFIPLAAPVGLNYHMLWIILILNLLALRKLNKLLND